VTFLRSTTVRVARLLRFEHEGGMRFAVVRCPWCGDEHRHVYPADVIAGAPGHRTPGCGRRHPDYAIAAAHEETS
jgi:hypothetical protein